jgi:hypothetical protein
MDREKTKSTHKRLLNTSTKEKVKEVKVILKKDDKPIRKQFISIKEMQDADPTYNQFSVLSNVN